jgi:predicted transcriptional regulator
MDSVREVMTEAAVLLSIHHTHAEAILAGRKTVELRRVPPKNVAGRMLIMYATLPRGAVVGHALIAEVITLSPDALWDLHGREAGVSKRIFSAYFEGVSAASALRLEAPREWPQAIDLHTLRTAYHLDPPQSWRYVDPAVVRSLLSGGAGAREGKSPTTRIG